MSCLPYAWQHYTIHDDTTCNCKKKYSFLEFYLEWRARSKRVKAEERVPHSGNVQIGSSKSLDKDDPKRRRTSRGPKRYAHAHPPRNPPR
mmetsp:Transcript_34846/g.57636  ORF Transcript_34846/g.57636 Transcript_34846/m.57636 type:complete len:90 (+) Transcript_34846:127-396(+)